MRRRIKRTYRQQKSPAKALSFCKRVKQALTDNPHIPDSFWGGHSGIKQRYFEAVDRYEVAYHLAINGDRLLIRERDKLMAEIILMLDEIASQVEAGSVRNPEALFTSGFHLTKERTSSSKMREPLVAPSDFTITNAAQRGKATGRARAIRGAINQEIQINKKDPSLEEEWLHKGVHPNAAEMEMENLDSGNIFFRVRYHGPDGPGPWSVILNTTIT